MPQLLYSCLSESLKNATRNSQFVYNFNYFQIGQCKQAIVQDTDHQYTDFNIVNNIQQRTLLRHNLLFTLRCQKRPNTTFLTLFLLFINVNNNNTQYKIDLFDRVQGRKTAKLSITKLYYKNNFIPLTNLHLKLEKSNTIMCIIKYKLIKYFLIRIVLCTKYSTIKLKIVQLWQYIRTGTNEIKRQIEWS